MLGDNGYDEIYKVVIVGDSGVGKSNILSRYVKDEFRRDSKCTVGVEFGSKIIRIDNTVIKVQIWDTAGQERYRSISSTYYRGSKGIFVVYDITQRSTFDRIDRWYNEVKGYLDETSSIILVGNKCDLNDRRQITQEEGQSKARALGIPFFETSALANIQIDLVFNSLVEEIYSKTEKTKDDDYINDDFEIVQQNGSDIILMNFKAPFSKKRKCC